MVSETLHLELFVAGQWHRALEMRFLAPELGRDGAVRCAYDEDYVESHLDAIGAVDERAVSALYPVGFDLHETPGWPAFLFDIAPAGAARRWWERRLALAAGGERTRDFALLSRCTQAPVGNARVAQSVVDAVPTPFTVDDVLDRADAFLDMATAAGAAVGGATGAGGDAPKVLLVGDAEGRVYPEGALADAAVAEHWLVKWARGQATQRDDLVLYAEVLFARALRGLDVDIVDVERWEDGSGRRACAWLRRFDRAVTEAGVRREAVESLYSLVGSTRPGAEISHQAYLAGLSRALRSNGQSAEVAGVVTEYVCRDLLNLIVGNSDNHGRNTSILRTGGRLRLAPIYDLAPMVMDPEGVLRSSRWGHGLERGHRVDWPGVCAEVGEMFPGVDVLGALREFADRLGGLEAALVDLGLPAEVFAAHGVHLRGLRGHLEDWGLG